MAPRKPRKSPVKKRSTKTAATKEVEKTIASKTEEVKAETVKTAEEAPASKPVAETAAADTTETKTTARKTADTAKKTATRRPRQAVEKKAPNVDHYFEIDQDQVKTADIVEKIYADYKAAGHQIGRIKKLDIYYNFEERKAYYVINDKIEGGSVDF